MAKCNSAQKVTSETMDIGLTDVMTGGTDKRMYLYYQLVSSLKKADSVDIVVSFLIFQAYLFLSFPCQSNHLC